MLGHASAATRHVWQGSPGPAPPYTNWATAAHVIQDAVDAAQTGDTVWVAGGVYATGGRAAGTNLLVNRVAIDRAITVQSLMGPEVTSIVGSGPSGSNAVRCVYLTNGAVLAGFTLTNGATQTSGDYDTDQSGGGVWCESLSAVVSNCVLTGNSASGGGGGAYSGTLKNCTLTGNSAGGGGGGWNGTLYNCTLTGNSASGDGGGALGGTLYDCTLTGNSARRGGGGGTSFGTLNNCTLTGNSAEWGGGAYQSTLNNCTLTGNWAYGSVDVAGLGGGVFGCTLNNCTLTGNSAGFGGGASESTLNDCTLTGNSADFGGGAAGAGDYWGIGACTLNNCTLTGNSATYGGGAAGDTLNNCIVYYNAAPSGGNYDEWSKLDYCCTTPMPTNGVGNFTNGPLFVDTNGWSNLRLQTNSPCINAGNNAYALGPNDLDGNPRVAGGRVDLGAYEFQGTGLSGLAGWLWQYGLPTDGSADYLDTDHDGHNNWQEWRCQTDPTNALSVLHLLPASSDGTHVTVTWQSVPGVTYFLERSTDLSASPPFTLLAPNLPGQPGITTYTDTNAAPLPPLFYRVGVAN